jgi:hypothetical protein
MPPEIKLIYELVNFLIDADLPGFGTEFQKRRVYDVTGNASRHNIPVKRPLPKGFAHQQILILDSSP